jgi:hypothetical protein
MPKQSGLKMKFDQHRKLFFEFGPEILMVKSYVRGKVSCEKLFNSILQVFRITSCKSTRRP